jgi:hypothetical protein
VGDARARTLISAYLSRERAQPVTEDSLGAHLRRVKRVETAPRLEAVTTLERFLETRPEPSFNYDLFRAAIDQGTRNAQRIFSGHAPLERRSFMVGKVNEPGDMGGFHSKYGIGFQYISHFAFSSVLNPAFASDPDVRALELARCYLHDSVHAGTYRSFAWNDAKGAPVRIRYGLNSRTPAGISYSGASLTKEAPHAINLNLLMDGAIVLFTEKTLAPFCAGVPRDSRTTAQRDVLAELEGAHGNVENGRVRRFLGAVPGPTRSFLAYWDEGDTLHEDVLRGMLSGDVQALRARFDGALDKKGGDASLQSYIARRVAQDPRLDGAPAWERLFLSKDYKI